MPDSFKKNAKLPGLTYWTVLIYFEKTDSSRVPDFYSKSSYLDLGLFDSSH